MELLKLPQVLAKCGMSRSAVYECLNDPNSDFPRPVRLGKRAIAFPAHEIEAFIERRIQERDEGQPHAA